jgi:biotin-(acetyl-CoA carboxylase) ligase
MLTETVQLVDKIGIILGLGINLQLSEEASLTIGQPATSLAAFSNKKYSPKGILPKILEIFLINLQVLQEKGFAVFKKNFIDFLAYKGEEIALNNGNKRVTGTCQGVAADGRLQVLLPQGELLLFWSGHE